MRNCVTAEFPVQFQVFRRLCEIQIRNLLMVLRPRTKAKLAKKSKRCPKCGKIVRGLKRCKTCHMAQKN